MPGPVDLALTGVMGATAASCLARAVRGGPASPRRDADATHAVMALAMAAMLLGVLRAPLAPVGLVGFALAGLWFARATVVEVAGRGGRAVLTGHGAWLTLTCAAMVAMLVPARGAATATATSSPAHLAMAGMPGMGALGSGTTWSGSAAVIVGLALAGAVLALALLPARCRVAGRTPVLATSCQVAMGATMAYAVLAMAFPAVLAVAG